ncbi:MAG TPA: ABC transporter substrate-binding protein [Ktedonobacterales bacterium]|nr:ABC transporter substrate-binding protein [Ktedonobacterales bacterium]
MMRYTKCLLVFCLLAAIFLSGCASPPSGDAPLTVAIAYQPGMGYAQLILMKQQHILERQFPQTHFIWTVQNNGYNIRNEAIAGHVQVGAGAIGTFIIGWDRGVDWRMLIPLNVLNAWLMTNDPSIHSIRDIKPWMKIAVPSLDSITAMMLRKAALETFGNAYALDANMIAISQPDATKALAAGKITLHFATPPYCYQDKAAGSSVLLQSFDIWGPSTFNFVFMLNSFYDHYPVFAKTLYGDILAATHLITTDPATAAQLLSQDQGGKPTATQYTQWLHRTEVTFTNTPQEIMGDIHFMYSIGLIYRLPSALSDIEFPPLYGIGS